MSETFVSPSNSIKIKNRNAARKIKNGSPKLQEELREVKILFDLLKY